MNQQYAKNLQNLAQASKDYTDNKTSELYDILSEFEPYKVKESDFTITGTSSPFPVTLSSELETAVLSGKRALFVNGTLANAISQGEITTDTLFNVISYDKGTQPGYKHIIMFSTYTSWFGIGTFSILFMQDDNDQWYALYYQGNFDTDDLYNQLSQLRDEVSTLDSRVTTLEESSGGTELYSHNIKLRYTSGLIFYDITFSFIESYSEPYTNSGLLYSQINSMGFTSSDKVLSVSGIYRNNNDKYPINALYCSGNNWSLGFFSTSYGFNNVGSSMFTVNDTVYQLS